VASNLCFATSPFDHATPVNYTCGESFHLTPPVLHDPAKYCVEDGQVGCFLLEFLTAEEIGGFGFRQPGSMVADRS
jgi:hypothetical protein